MIEPVINAEVMDAMITMMVAGVAGLYLILKLTKDKER